MTSDTGRPATWRSPAAVSKAGFASRKIQSAASSPW